MTAAIKLIVLASLFVFSQASFAGEAETLDELIDMNDPSVCMECHDETTPSWKDSSHSVSLVDPPVIRALKNTLSKMSEAQWKTIKQACLACHIPQIRDASDKLVEEFARLIIKADDTVDPAVREAARQKLSEFSIDCRVCHMIKGLREEQGRRDIVYGPGWNEHEHSHKDEYGYDTLKSDYLISSALCSSCHIECSSEKATSSYKEVHACFDGHYAEAKKSCQYCHMKSNYQNKHSFTVGSF